MNMFFFRTPTFAYCYFSAYSTSVNPLNGRNIIPELSPRVRVGQHCSPADILTQSELLVVSSQNNEMTLTTSNEDMKSAWKRKYNLKLTASDYI